MQERISAKEAANRWGLSERSVTGMCKDGKIAGAAKEAGVWTIPADAEKPVDGRVKSGAFQIHAAKSRLPLPVGISDYRIASTQYYYVDKTMMIKDYLDDLPAVSLFTRPRRFGKTLNMDMLRTFFEKTDEDTSKYFRGKAIWRQGARYRNYQGRYPVIFVTFKDVKCNTWEETLEKLAEIIGSEFSRHSEVLASDACEENDKVSFTQIRNRTATATKLSDAFLILTRMLHACHGVAPIIIVDEYDTPIQQGHTKEFYDQVISFMRNLFSGGLKDNKHLSYGFLTGILRVAKESIFSGLNNLAVNSVLDDKYSAYFGFTADEVKTMAEYYGAGSHFDELCEWYDGYRFGSTEIFNPWSVINYFRNNCTPGPYWQSTGNNEIIGEVLSEAGPDIYEHLQMLLQDTSFYTTIDTGVVYPEIRKNPSSVYSFLLVAGYLKLHSEGAPIADGMMRKVSLPNKEIAYVYKKEILNQLAERIPQSTADVIREAIYTGNVDALQAKMRQFLLQTVSSFDTANEIFYHGLVLGLCAIMDSHYEIRSNRESGEGRYDIQLKPLGKDLPGILIELKAAKGANDDDLHVLAKSAVRQINERQYATELLSAGISHILKYGVAFRGKFVEVEVETTGSLS